MKKSRVPDPTVLAFARSTWKDNFQRDFLAIFADDETQRALANFLSPLNSFPFLSISAKLLLMLPKRGSFIS